MTAALAIALGLVALLGSACFGLVIHILSGIRDDLRGLREDLRGLSRRVSEHDSFITAYKLKLAQEAQ